MPPVKGARKKTMIPRRRFSEGQGGPEVAEGEAVGDADERYDNKKGKSIFLHNAVSSPLDHFTLHPLADLFIPTTTTTRLLWVPAF